MLQRESGGPRTRGATDVDLGPMARETNVPVQQPDSRDSLPSLDLCSIQALHRGNDFYL